MKKAYAITFTTLLTLSMLLSACGREELVSALNLKTGQTQTFAGESEVPDGWAVCETPSCDSVPPTVPCQNLGAALCELEARCEAQTYCLGVAPVQGDGCFTNCEPRDKPQACEDLDMVQCEARADCGLLLASCLPCAEPGCDPCPAPGCETLQPQPCDQLDEQSCLSRTECEWSPMPCLPCADPEGDDEPVGCGLCPSFCRAKPVVCPELSPPTPGFCNEGMVAPERNDEGCVIGYRCDHVCLPNMPPMPECEHGTLVEEQDEHGCLVSFRCERDE